MIVEIKVPSPGESISEVEISNWLVKDGEFVEKDQEICEVDSDKATLTIAAEESGVIKLLVKENESVSVGENICTINTLLKGNVKQNKVNKIIEKNIISGIKKYPEVQGYAEGHPSPSARKILSEKNLQISQGTGKSGRITKEDAIKALPPMGNKSGFRDSKRVKMSTLRRKISERLVTVKNETAMLTTFNEVDMKNVMEIRNKFKEDFKIKHGISLGYMSFFTKAVTRSLKLFPQVNSIIDSEDIVTFNYFDVSIAVSSPKGLMVPVIRNADKLSFFQIEKEISRLAIKVRDGNISIDDMIGGTFTITNGGVFGSMLSTPIINPPQSAILGMHNIVQRPVVVNGKIEIRPIMYIALSYDHRIIDGKDSVGFLMSIKESIEDPSNYLINNKIKFKDNFGI
ncbi:MAG: 2-oxoglutarate dehydrogenase complex dihydrolipoyllysine-residue succinyltransferase [Flavobacteriales bacterium TMED288]|nr:dihydrolipoyllysine-residue succinyltransferase [Flavobacteriales bacterium]RPG53792.1 MAG: 2-oxoglutarate dehydrogenase complex dihydrolipoyllysine-residue succinyltransferase [Flavobacteriales bacterium TMED288]|tara:strand:- start:1255 stop:2454 length:1200 start_codon:yes stop_codon:yes gene_type:complete